MGVVYEAHDPALDRAIALKTISLGFALSPEALRSFEERFFTEARIAARLCHPGIVVVHDAGRDPESGVLYIALELLEGRTLAEIQSPLDWREALRLTRSVAEALDYAHSRKVVHRDIKPANIMLLGNGETKLMDFGIAKMETARIKVTGTGQFFGTPLYMAPELALARKVDARADLFSLGAVCYALLTGRQAFAAANIPAIVTRIVQEDPAPPSSLVAEIPAEVDELVAHVLAKEPDERHPSARALVEDLEDVLAGRRARHSVDLRGATQARRVPHFAIPAPPPEGTEELELLLSVPDGENPPAGVEVLAESPLSALVPEAPRAPAAPGRVTPGAPSRVSPAQPARMAPSIAPPSRRPHRSGRWPVLALIAAVALGLLSVLPALFTGRSPSPPVVREAARSASRTPPTGDRTDEASAAPDVTPLPTAEAAAPAASTSLPSARLLVDFEHPLKSGRLRLWVNGEIALDERLQGRVEKKLKVIKLREGGLEETLKLAPGRHEIKVAVSWDDNEERESISGLFREGQTRHLEIRLGRLRKNLSLDWS